MRVHRRAKPARLDERAGQVVTRKTAPASGPIRRPPMKLMPMR